MADEDILEYPSVTPMKNYNSSIIPLAFSFYLLEKYENVCVADYLITWRTSTNKIYYESKPKCTKRFYIGFIHLFSAERKAAHLNSFIVDQKEKTVELFEPNGELEETMYNNDLYILEFKNYIEINFGKDYKIYNPLDFCPRISFQYLQALEIETETLKTEDDPRGFCIFWSIWWIEYRIKHQNSKLSRLELVDKALKYFSTHNMTNYIRRLSHFFAKYTLDLLKKYNLNIDNFDEVFEKFVEIEKLFQQELLLKQSSKELELFRFSNINEKFQKLLLQDAPKKVPPKKTTLKKPKCPPGKIINPDTERCVLISGKIGKAILQKTSAKKTQAKKTSAKCPSDKIINPDTNRCVLKTGKIGKTISPKKAKKTPTKKTKCPSGKIFNPDSKRCVLKTGKIGKAILSK